jgi:hypothetical protein
MINAKQEFLDHISERCINGRTVHCAWIKLYNAKNKVESILHVGYTPEDLEIFLKEIDQEYNNGYGGQNLYGTIWYSDGLSWSQRGECDGSEWWEVMERPEIPLELY